ATTSSIVTNRQRTTNINNRESVATIIVDDADRERILGNANQEHQQKQVQEVGDAETISVAAEMSSILSIGGGDIFSPVSAISSAISPRVILSGTSPTGAGGGVASLAHQHRTNAADPKRRTQSNISTSTGNVVSGSARTT
ncbi:unnamed protein product, partial [Amoebophrya sp. A25]